MFTHTNRTGVLFSALLTTHPKAFSEPQKTAWVHALWASLLCSALLVGCGSVKDDATLAWSNEKLHAEAKDEAASNRFDAAIKLYEKLENRAAGTVLAQQAQLERAYSLYKSNENANALLVIERFIKSYPSSPVSDYALYLKGLINFNENLGLVGRLIRIDLSERDQKAARDSLDSFNQLIQKFPQSKYAADAAQRVQHIVNSLAQYELHVAQYYFDRKAYPAAIARLQTLMTDFRGVPAQQQGLNLLIQSYDALGMTTLRDDARRVYQNTYAQQGQASKPLSGSAWWKFW